MSLGLVVSIKKQVFALATAFSLCFCIETRGVLLVFASCVGSVARRNDVHLKTEGPRKEQEFRFTSLLKALSHGAIFLATCNIILLLGDVKLANACFHHSLLIYS